MMKYKLMMELENHRYWIKLIFENISWRINTAEIDQGNRDFFDILPLKCTIGPNGDVGAHICWYILVEREKLREKF